MEVHTERREPEARIPAYVLRSPEWAELCHGGGLAPHVLLLLHAHARENEAWVSQRRLASLVGAWRGSVQEAIERLVAAGWVKRSERRGKRDHRRLADLYSLGLPPAVEAARVAFNDALTKGSTEGVQHPLWREGDVFAWRSGIHVREARVPLSVLVSEPFTALRERGIAMHLWLLLLAYGKAGLRVGKRSLAADLHVVHSRVTEALSWLRGDHPRATARIGPATGLAWITTERGGAEGNVADRHVVRLVPRPVADEAPVAGPGPAAEVLDRAQFPPAELVSRLSPMMRAIVEEWRELHAAGEWTDVAQAWNALELEAICAPPPKLDPWAGMSPQQAAIWLVRAFHRAARGAADYHPTIAEIRIARKLVEQHGYGALKLVESAIAQAGQTGWRPGNFAAVTRYIGT